MRGLLNRVRLAVLVVLLFGGGAQARSAPNAAGVAEVRYSPGATRLLEEARRSDIGFQHSVEARTRVEALYRRALDAQMTERGGDQDAVVSLMALVASVLRSEGKSAEAEALARSAADAAREKLGPDHVRTADCLNAYGAILIDAERYSVAQDALDKALQIRVRSYGTPSAPVAETRMKLALVKLGQGNIDAALPLARQSLTEYRAIRRAPPEYAWLYGAILRDLAAVLIEAGYAEESDQLLEEASYELSGSLGPNHSETLAVLQLWRVWRRQFETPDTHGARIYSNNESYSALEAARLSARRALGAMGDHPYAADALDDLAWQLRQEGLSAEAEGHARRAADIRERWFGRDSARGGEARLGLAFVLQSDAEREALIGAAVSFFDGIDSGSHAATSARVWLAQRRLRDRRFPEATALAERAMSDARVQQYRVSRTATVQSSPLARDRADLAAQIYLASLFEAAPTRADLGFNAAQAVRASLASDAIAEARARAETVTNGVAALEQAARRQREEIAALDRRTSAQGLTHETLRQLPEARARLESLELQLRNAAPRYFDFTRETPVSIADAQALLGANEALVLLVPGIPTPDGGVRSLVIAINRTQAAWARTDLEDEVLGRQITELTDALKPGTQSAFNTERAHDVYQSLFGAPSIEAVLRDTPKIVIVPKGRYLSTPFNALVMSASAQSGEDASRYRAARWFGLEKAISIAPSISSLRALRAAPVGGRTWETPFFGVGDPAFSGAAGGRAPPARDVYVARDGVAAAVRRLPRLAASREEIIALARTLGAPERNMLLGREASDAAIKRLDGVPRFSGAEVIAFATHGLMSGDMSGVVEPALALTPPSLSSGGNDGLLTASEIAELHLSARWVILSACNTAAGGSVDAEGLSGLARAFFLAGARGLLVSQWSVYDAASARLTTRAIELQQSVGLSEPEALRQSMRALMDDASADASSVPYSHPVVWAPFLYVGGG